MKSGFILPAHRVSRGRIAAQLLTESLVLGALGGLGGVGLAAVLIGVAVPVLPVAIPFTAEISLNLRVLAFAVVTVFAVSALVGLLPPIHLSSGSVSTSLNSAARGSSGTHDRVRRAIVATEVAVSLILICGSLLLFKSLLGLQRVDIGVRVENVITMSLELSRDRCPSAAHAAAFYGPLVERVQAIPGVVSASVSGDVPLAGTGGENLRMPGREDRLPVRFKRPDHGYFTTMRIPVVAGRGFTGDDQVGAPYVVVINEALARRLEDRFGVTNPVGQAIDLPALGFGPDRRALMTVVGVIRNERVTGDLRMAI